MINVQCSDNPSSPPRFSPWSVSSSNDTTSVAGGGVVAFDLPLSVGGEVLVAFEASGSSCLSSSSVWVAVVFVPGSKAAGHCFYLKCAD